MKYELPLKYSQKTRLITSNFFLDDFFYTLIIRLLYPTPPSSILQHFYHSNICVISLETKYKVLWPIHIR